mmetsp:Transcript_28058/g.37300  ORF Transcript_28058/g.37300 Transcript_28058/m.37300 type:complete len:98 (-) Transcript_28058:255-548(-)
MSYIAHILKFPECSNQKKEKKETVFERKTKTQKIVDLNFKTYNVDMFTPHLLEENRDVPFRKTDNFLSWDVCIIKFHILAISFQSVKLLGGRERVRE